MRLSKRGKIIVIASLAIFTLGFIPNGTRLLRTNIDKRSTGLSDPLLFCLVPHQSVSSSRSTFGFMAETFNNQGTRMTNAPRGGDLALLDENGDIRLLTAEAGYGVGSGELQDEAGIAVREPSVSFDGCRALFSMLVGGPVKAFDQSYTANRWQIYEITNLCDVLEGAVPAIIRITAQPADYNNFSPVYSPVDNEIIFISDQPIGELHHTYPPLDEYESSPTNSGVWKLNTETEEVAHLSHSPSGDFDLFVASDGRVLFTRWSHNQQDQQMAAYDLGINELWEPDVFVDESENADLEITDQFDNDGNMIANADGDRFDVFPEPRTNSIQFDPDKGKAGFKFNEFQIWEINPNGERNQTINHIGRHEFGGAYTDGSFVDDRNLTNYESAGTQFTANKLMRGRTAGFAGFFQVTEDPRPGMEGNFYYSYGPEFNTLASGYALHSYIPTSLNPEDLVVNEVSLNNDGYVQGHFRDLKILSNGDTLVSHTPDAGTYNSDEGRPFNFRLKLMANKVPQSAILGDPITKEIVYWGDFADPISVEVQMLELWPEPIIARTRPPVRAEFEIDPIEMEVIQEEGVDVDALRAWLIENDLALIAVRDITKRDRADVQQPYNLEVPGGVSTIADDGAKYEISHFQMFQAEVTKGYTQRGGRRVFYNPFRNTITHPELGKQNPYALDGPTGSVKIDPDGSAAAFVPAARSVAWQTVSPENESIVIERQPLSFAAGEIMTCPGCHGINKEARDGSLSPENKPEALRKLLRHWKQLNGLITNSNIEERQNEIWSIYPNPVEGFTNIAYQVGNEGVIRISIVDLLGQKVTQLFDGYKAPGSHKVMWETNNVRPGMYVCIIEIGNSTYSSKVLVRQ